MAAKGQVYVFNTTNIPVNVQVNGIPISGTVPASSPKYIGTDPSADNSYSPGGPVSVPRDDSPTTTDAEFATTSSVRVVFPGFNNTYATVKIDPTVFATNTDLVLYVFSGAIIVYSILNNQVVFSGVSTGT